MVELFYEVKLTDESNDHRRNVEAQKPICTLSVRNLVAFTSKSDLCRKETCKSKSKHGSDVSTGAVGSNVFVADLNTPWNCHLVRQSESSVTHLQWDTSGVQLMVGTEHGLVEMYGMVEELLDKWSVLYTAEFCGEPILTSCWLSAPRHVRLMPDKLDSFLYSEKYEVSAIRRGRGFNKSLEGAVLVTATGLLTAFIRSQEDHSRAITAVEKMIPLRTRLLFADMSYGKGGEIVVACSSGKANHPIKISRVNASLVGASRDKAEVTVQAGHSLFLPSAPECVISGIKFLNKVNTESLLVALKSIEGRSGHLYLYELVSTSTPLRSRFQNGNGIETTQTSWQQMQSISFPSPIEEFCTLGIPVTTPLSASPGQHQNHISNTLQSQVGISLSDGNLHFIRTDNFQQVGVVPGNSDHSSEGGLQLKRDPDDVPEPKQMKLATPSETPSSSATPSYVSMQFTWSGSMLLAMDPLSQLHLYKMYPNVDPGIASALIELSMMGGLDPWDILMCLRPTIIENVIDRLSEGFARQPPAVQSYYNTGVLVIKAALHRLASGNVTRTNDQQTLLTLHLVSGALKALLRPRNLAMGDSHDRGPAETLSNLLSTKGEALSDLDKVLLHLEVKEYSVEPTLLQSLQQFLQWCADLSLKLLAILPDLRNSRAPGWEVCRDSKAVGTLRELIVLMRIWGLIRPACLPSFRKTTENLDVLPLLFRLLTKLSVTPHDPDESLIDKAYLDRPIPELQNISVAKNERAYTWFYVSIGFAALVLFLLVFGWFWNKRKAKQAEAAEHRQRLPFESPDSFQNQCESAVFSTHSILVSTVQPKANSFEKGDYPSPQIYPTNGSGKGMTFGCYKQQPPQQNIHMKLQNEALMETLDAKRDQLNSDTGNGKPSLRKGNSLIYVPGRNDSLDAYYAMDPTEKTPLQRQLEDASEFRTYLHLTSGMSRGDSLELESEASTLPLSNEPRSSIENVQQS